MDLGDYLLVRRKAADVLRGDTIDARLSFEEAALLCHLSLVGEPLRSSGLAAYEGVIRPTMSHRLQRLAKAGLLERSSGDGDRRAVLYGITDRGRWLAGDFLEAMALAIAEPDHLASVSPERLGRYVEAAGTVPANASDLVLLALWSEGRPLQATEVQRRCGLLQPTCSMALVSLVGRGLVERALPDDGAGVAAARELGIDASPTYLPARLTEQGRLVAGRLAERVSKAVVHR